MDVAVGAAAREKVVRFGGNYPPGLSWRKTVEAAGRRQVSCRRNRGFWCSSQGVRERRNPGFRGRLTWRRQMASTGGVGFLRAYAKGILFLGAESWRLGAL